MRGLAVLAGFAAFTLAAPSAFADPEVRVSTQTGFTAPGFVPRYYNSDADAGSPTASSSSTWDSIGQATASASGGLQLGDLKTAVSTSCAGVGCTTMGLAEARVTFEDVYTLQAAGSGNIGQVGFTLRYDGLLGDFAPSGDAAAFTTYVDFRAPSVSIIRYFDVFLGNDGEVFHSGWTTARATAEPGVGLFSGTMNLEHNTFELLVSAESILRAHSGQDADFSHTASIHFFLPQGVTLTSESGFFEGFSTAAVDGVPEPATWALMLAGFGLSGGVLRRRRSLASA
jgi:hypothetical protein